MEIPDMPIGYTLSITVREAWHVWSWIYTRPDGVVVLGRDGHHNDPEDAAASAWAYSRGEHESQSR